MSVLDWLLTKDTVTILRQQVRTSKSMAVVKSWVPVGTFLCRVIPLAVSERMKLMKSGYQVTHKLRCMEDPRLGLGDRLDVYGTILRIVPPYNPHLMDVFFTFYATSATEDNQTTSEIL